MLSTHGIGVPIAASSATAMAYLVYRIYAHRARRGRHHLRTEVRNERESLRRVVDALPEQLESVKRSRMAAAGFRGPRSGEALQGWLGEFEDDLAQAKQLRAQLPAADADGSDDAGMELDLELAEVLALSIRANRLAEKYRHAASELESSADLAAEELDPESLFEQAASMPVQARAQHAAVSFVAPS